MLEALMVQNRRAGLIVPIGVTQVISKARGEV